MDDSETMLIFTFRERHDENDTVSFHHIYSPPGALLNFVNSIDGFYGESLRLHGGQMMADNICAIIRRHDIQASSLSFVDGAYISEIWVTLDTEASDLSAKVASIFSSLLSTPVETLVIGPEIDLCMTDPIAYANRRDGNIVRDHCLADFESKRFDACMGDVTCSPNKRRL